MEMAADGAHTQQENKESKENERYIPSNEVASVS